MRGVGLADHIEFLVRSLSSLSPFFLFPLSSAPEKVGRFSKVGLEGVRSGRGGGGKKTIDIV